MRILRAIVVSLFLLNFALSNVHADEVRARYFDQLRKRGLYSLAESEALSKLANSDLSLAMRSEFSIELSRTLMEHAGFVADDQRNELWQRAKSTIQQLLDQDRSNPRTSLLKGQIASVYVGEADWLRAERELRPFDESLLQQALDTCSKAIEALKAIETSLTEPTRESAPKKPAGSAPAGHEVRTLLHQVRYQLGQTYRNRAELLPRGSAERTKDLADAEQSLRRLIGAADEPLQTRAKLLLVDCTRIKNELDRAAEGLAILEKLDPKISGPIEDELIAERVRLLMDMKRPTEAADLLLKTRSKRRRLTGELWLLQTRSLIALREVATSKHQESLADEVSKQIVTTLQRCDEQVGGFWSRRCRQLWENTRTAEKYGPELDALMQQARSDFTAGRIDAALAQYAAAEKLAVQQKQADLATELGFTHASILLDGQKWDTAAAGFLRLAVENPKHARAAKAHLLGTYCLGRLYDEKKTQARREAYTEALDRHLKNYPSDETTSDARFLKAQLEEQRLQATLALPLYVQIESNHPRFVEAMAGAARCYETIIRRMIEKQIASVELQDEAIARLTAFLSTTGESMDSWKTEHAEIALHLAAVMLMGLNDRDGKSAKNQALSEIARCQKAERWLNQVLVFADRKGANATSPEVQIRLRQRAAPLLIVALAGGGKFDEAEKSLKSTSMSSAELLATLDRLTQFAATLRGEQQKRVVSLQLQVAERLNSIRDQLASADAELLDRCVINGYLYSGQYPKGVELAQRVAERSAKNVDKQIEIAKQFSDLDNLDAQSLAKQCWRRVESLSKTGSTEWLAARLAVLKMCVRLKQFDEGRKLMQVTRVLYPELGGDPLNKQFEAVEHELLVGKSG